MRNFLLFGSIVLLGCSGIDTSEKTSSSSGNGGSMMSASTSNSGGVGGSACQPKITCQSVGAECGLIKDDGCGHSSNCPDNCIAPMVCGGDQDKGQFKCGCTTTTCEEQGKNCGTIDNNCGKSLNCGTCDPNKYQTTCGDAKIGDFPSPNVCGGGCILWTENSINCVGESNAKNLWLCTSAAKPIMPEPPLADCVSTTDDHLWCCP